MSKSSMTPSSTVYKITRSDQQFVSGGPFDFVCLSARCPPWVGVLTSQRNQEIYPRARFYRTVLLFSDRSRLGPRLERNETKRNETRHDKTKRDKARRNKMRRETRRDETRRDETTRNKTKRTVRSSRATRS